MACYRCRKLRPERQPTEGGGVNAGLPPGGDLGDEAGAGDFRGGERQAAGIALVEVKAGQSEMDDGRCVEWRTEKDRKPQDADFIVRVGRGRGERPAFGEHADLHRGRQGFPGLHKSSNQKVCGFSLAAADDSARSALRVKWWLGVNASR